MRAVDVSLPAFEFSVHATCSLVDALTSCVNGLEATTEFNEAAILWDKLSGATECHTVEFSLKQIKWVDFVCKAKFISLLEE